MVSFVFHEMKNYDVKLLISNYVCSYVNGEIINTENLQKITNFKKGKLTREK